MTLQGLLTSPAAYVCPRFGEEPDLGVGEGLLYYGGLYKGLVNGQNRPSHQRKVAATHRKNLGTKTRVH